MAKNQAALHELGRTGQEIVKKMTNGESQTHKAPFDVVDFQNGFAYEVKTMSSLSADLKIHIAASSYSRKVKFARQYGLKKILIAVVIGNSPDDIKLFKSPMRKSIRVSQMKEVK